MKYTYQSQSLLGGDQVHASTFGRLDAAVGDDPTRFSREAKHLQPYYLRGYREQQELMVARSAHRIERAVAA